MANRAAHSQTSGSWEYDANYRLTKIGSGSCGSSGTVCYSYDDAGNLIQKTEANKSTQYSYDSQNRLIEVRSGAQGSEVLIAQYGYDPMNRRLWKLQVRDKAGQLLPQAKRTFYLYSDEGLIAESTESVTLNPDGSISSQATPKITAQYGSKPGNPFTTGVLFIKTKNSNGQDTIAYYHHDHLGTPIQAMNKNGKVVWAARYEPFGKASIITPQATVESPTITSNLRLPGQYEDEETGLHYNWNRYYDVNTGRYITEDPIGLLGGINAFVYVNARPANVIDPSGLRPVEEYLTDWICGAKSWEDAFNTARNKKMKGFDVSDPFDADNRTAAEHYIFGRLAGSGEANMALTIAYLATGSYWGYAYQAAKELGLYPHASPPSYAQLYWEEKAYTDAIGLTLVFTGEPGKCVCGK